MKEITKVKMAKGGTCIKAFVRTKKGNEMQRAVALKWKGPDSNDVMQVIPSPFLSCNPVVMSCLKPYQNKCGPSIKATP